MNTAPRLTSTSPLTGPTILPFRLLREDDDGTLSAASRLSQIFARFYLPNVLSEEKHAAADTITANRESLDKWVRITGDPPVGAITKDVWEQFRAGLAGPFTRGLGSPRLLRENTQIKHLGQIHSMLERCTSETDADRRLGQGKLGILADLPRLVVPPRPVLAVPPCFQGDEPQRIFAACDVMRLYGTGSCAKAYRHRRGDGGDDAPARWRSLWSLIYYAGFRIGGLQAFRPRHVRSMRKRHYIDIPAGEQGLKKGQAVIRYVHPHAWNLLEPLLAAAPSSDVFVFPFLRKHEESHLLDRFRFLQRAAGLEEAEFGTFHDGRRTHGDLMTDRGFDQAVMLGSLALGHKDPKVTLRHYVEIEPKYIDRLPLLDPAWRPAPEVSPQRRFEF